VVRIKDGRRELVMLRWGWGKMKNGNEWINARSEGRAPLGGRDRLFELDYRPRNSWASARTRQLGR
jgi:hypothetical protein